MVMTPCSIPFFACGAVRSLTKKPRAVILGFQLPGQPAGVFTTPAAHCIKVVVGTTTKKGQGINP
jgi:hypothetical protein